MKHVLIYTQPVQNGNTVFQRQEQHTFSAVDDVAMNEELHRFFHEGTVTFNGTVYRREPLRLIREVYIAPWVYATTRK